MVFLNTDVHMTHMKSHTTRKPSPNTVHANMLTYPPRPAAYAAVWLPSAVAAFGSHSRWWKKACGSLEQVVPWHLNKLWDTCMEIANHSYITIISKIYGNFSYHRALWARIFHDKEAANQIGSQSDWWFQRRRWLKFCNRWQRRCRRGANWWQ